MAESKPQQRSLFSIEQDYLELMSDIETAEGVLDESLEARLAISVAEFDKKVSAYAYLVQKYKGEQAMVNDEIDRLSGRITMYKGIEKRLKDSIENAFTIRGIRTYKTTLHTVFIKNNAENAAFVPTLDKNADEVEKDLCTEILKMATSTDVDPFAPAEQIKEGEVTLEMAKLERANTIENELGSALTFNIEASTNIHQLNKMVNVLEAAGFVLDKDFTVKDVKFRKKSLTERLKGGEMLSIVQLRRTESLIIR